jgi:hypothetical protein
VNTHPQAARVLFLGRALELATLLMSSHGSSLEAEVHLNGKQQKLIYLGSRRQFRWQLVRQQFE